MPEQQMEPQTHNASGLIPLSNWLHTPFEVFLKKEPRPLLPQLQRALVATAGNKVSTMKSVSLWSYLRT